MPCGQVIDILVSLKANLNSDCVYSLAVFASVTSDKTLTGNF
ncbi:hypothetical protein NIES4071_72620 [Calothrix sp. NIES-4071]|nr:hypothetical protein NIES4071_72620 [Calothrix sp. NIES-4071]BAZ61537.1 hypothetical protein NIES4105_72570 [Calothrix sp. NIES-4105]